MNRNDIKKKIFDLVDNGYAETYVGYHPDYRFWNGEFERGCYAQVAAPYGGTVRFYAPSYAELLGLVELDKDAYPMRRCWNERAAGRAL